jgi:hypothetical protein
MTSAATSHCRAFGASPPTGQSALAAPTSPTENVQTVSTQPELPVRCCATQPSRHQDGKRKVNGKECFKIRNSHTDTWLWPIDIGPLANTRSGEAGFNLQFRLKRPVDSAHWI